MELHEHVGITSKILSFSNSSRWIDNLHTIPVSNQTSYFLSISSTTAHIDTPSTPNKHTHTQTVLHIINPSQVKVKPFKFKFIYGLSRKKLPDLETLPIT